MCGFVCISEFSDPPSPDAFPDLLRRMNQTLVHRGPDDEGYFLTSTKEASRGFPNLGFAHRRLSILDLTPAGAQPMSSSEGDFRIVYNGEIFNYLEIRQELTENGMNFKTHSDTEVILKAYEQWGEKCLDRFNGMFAFVLWDQRRKLLFGARDRFGIKPFYYYWDGDCFLAASEVKALLCHPRIRRTANEETIYDYLLFGFQDHSEATFFRSIQQLPPSHFLAVDTQTRKMKIERWWDLKSNEPNGKSVDIEDAKHQFHDLLADSIKLRLRSDVPIGVCVSGGLDSSSIAYLIEKVEHNGRQNQAESHPARKGFSCCFEDSECDDRPFIEAVTKGLSMESHKVFPQGEDLWKELEEMTWMMDEPFRSSNQFSQWTLMKLISKNGIRVAMSGQGADEILGGYRGYSSVFIATLFRQRKWRQACREWVKTRSNERGISKLMLTGRILYGLSPSVFSNAVPLMERAAGINLKMKSREFIDSRFLQRHSGRYVDRLKNQHANWSNVRQKLYEDLFKYSLPQLLHYEDRMGMAFSVETRHPFLDHRLIECLYSLPASLIYRDGQHKWILRQSMSDILPEMISNRKDKKGFITPESRWTKMGGAYLTKLFSSGAGTASSSFINTDKILKALSSNVQKDPYSQHTDIWRPLNLEVWLQKFNVHA